MNMTETDADSQVRFKSCDATEIDSNLIVLTEFIANGTYGKVHKSVYNGRAVAVKQNTDEENYEKEKRSLMQVDHPNIVTLFAFCDAQRYLIMELCEDTLHNVLHERKDVKIKWGHALQWAKDCAETVDYLHSFTPQPLLHRDLKPANVLLVDQGRVIKLTDFGTMRQQADEMTNAIGTPIYMAPEVYVGKEYTTKCDVYSWSIMLWEILCQKIPLETLERCAILFQKVMRKVRPDPLQGCPKKIERLMTRCWDHDPNERPTMREVVTEINNIRESVPGLLETKLKPVYIETDAVLSGPIESLVRVASHLLPSPVSPDEDRTSDFKVLSVENTMLSELKNKMELQ